MQWIYTDDVGQIKQVHTGPASLQLPEVPGLHLHEIQPGDVDTAIHYWDGTEVKVRPQLPSALVDSTLLSIPDGAFVTIDGYTYTADGTDIELSFDLPGTYKIKVAHWPYQDWETVIENPAQG